MGPPRAEPTAAPAMAVAKGDDTRAAWAFAAAGARERARHPERAHDRRAGAAVAALHAALLASVWHLRAPEPAAPQPVSIVRITMPATPEVAPPVPAEAPAPPLPVRLKPAPAPPPPAPQLPPMPRPEVTPPPAPPLSAEPPPPDPAPPAPAPEPPAPPRAEAAESPGRSAPQAPAAPPEPRDASPVRLSGDLIVRCPQHTPPAYPDSAKRRGLTGRAVLAVEIDETGQVAQARVVRSSGAAALDQAALAAIATWRCEAPRRDGVPVRGIANQPFDFVLD